jgi:putative ABC transport system ATP-binding protein
VDSETAEKLLGIMHKLNRERAVTFIFSTHDARVMDHARRIVRLVDGQVASDETKREEDSCPVPPSTETLERN